MWRRPNVAPALTRRALQPPRARGSLCLCFAHVGQNPFRPVENFTPGLSQRSRRVVRLTSVVPSRASSALRCLAAIAGDNAQFARRRRKDRQPHRADKDFDTAKRSI